jgi:hypothetical protein
MLHEKGRPGEAANPESIAWRRHDDGSEQLHILDAISNAEAEARKRQGMDSSRYGEDARIVSAIETAILDVARCRETFTADDVLPELASRRSLGAAFNRLARRGDIVCVGATTSTRPDRHGGLCRVWSKAGGSDG